MNANGVSKEHEFPSVYKRSFQAAVVHGELEQFRASRKLNMECAKAIDAVHEKYFDEVTYEWNTEPAAKEVVGKFGFERTMMVLANTVQHYSWDGRFSDASRDWARTMPRLDRQAACLVSANAGWVNSFVDAVRYDHEMSQPLKETEIKAEAKHILKQLQSIPEPNSPDKAMFMAKISPEFNTRAKPEDFVKMVKMLPFSSTRLTTLPGQKGFFAVISSKEVRTPHQRLHKPSIKAQLAAKPIPGDQPMKPKDRGVR